MVLRRAATRVAWLGADECSGLQRNSFSNRCGFVVWPIPTNATSKSVVARIYKGTRVEATSKKNGVHHELCCLHPKITKRDKIPRFWPQALQQIDPSLRSDESRVEQPALQRHTHARANHHYPSTS